MPGRGTIDPIFILHQAQKKDSGKKQKMILDICEFGESF